MQLYTSVYKKYILSRSAAIIPPKPSRPLRTELGQVLQLRLQRLQRQVSAIERQLLLDGLQLVAKLPQRPGGEWAWYPKIMKVYLLVGGGYLSL